MPQTQPNNPPFVVEGRIQEHLLKGKTIFCHSYKQNHFYPLGATQVIPYSNIVRKFLLLFYDQDKLAANRNFIQHSPRIALSRRIP